MKNEAIRPEADAKTVEELVSTVLKGQVRIPSFQRGLKWRSEDVLKLFDSIYSGYPIGSLLFRKAPAQVQQIRVGPLDLTAPASDAASWVIDGQQRITALTAALCRPDPYPVTPTDPWCVYFDAATEKFLAPPTSGKIPATWAPVSVLLDASQLSEWVFRWVHGQNPEMRAVIFEAGKRIRQYEIPMYVVVTEDERLLREIFHRINQSGRPLEWHEVHDALFGHDGTEPSSVRGLVNELGSLGLGSLDEGQVLQCVMAFLGLDVTRTIDDHYQRNADILSNAVNKAAPAIKGALAFLVNHGNIPHLRLMPRSIPLIVLTRFFACFPNPRPRTIELLRRWTWRALIVAGPYDERTMLRHSISAVLDGHEDESVQNLLKTVSKPDDYKLEMGRKFDARSAESRVFMLALSSLAPLDLHSANPISLKAQLEGRHSPFRKIIAANVPLSLTAANRLIAVAGTGSMRRPLLNIIESNEAVGRLVLESHAISASAAVALCKGDAEEFLKQRKMTMERLASEMLHRLAGLGRNDRPSLGYLLESLSGAA